MNSSKQPCMSPTTITRLPSHSPRMSCIFAFACLDTTLSSSYSSSIGCIIILAKKPCIGPWSSSSDTVGCPFLLDIRFRHVVRSTSNQTHTTR